MKRTIFILFLFLFLFIPRTKSQIVQESHPAYKHFYHAVIDNDTVLVIELRTFHVFPPEKFKDKKQEKFYWKTVRDVKRPYPMPNSSTPYSLKPMNIWKLFPMTKLGKNT